MGEKSKVRREHGCVGDEVGHREGLMGKKKKNRARKEDKCETEPSRGATVLPRR